MYVVVGLGNPTKEYENTRHNVGFMCIDALAQAHDIRINENKFNALIGKGYIDGVKVILAKPLTYMNNSGLAVREIIDYFKVDPEDELIIIYDDIDLDVGKLRIRAKGSAGGHNGMKSIINHVGTQTFGRIRVGVGHKPEGWDLADYVLGRFQGDDKKVIDETIQTVGKVCEIMLTDGVDKAMNQYN